MEKYISIDLVRKLIKKAEADGFIWALRAVERIPCIEIGRCGKCKYFETDYVSKVDGVPLIVAHTICRRWGDGCKTRENGWCFLFEGLESEE